MPTLTDLPHELLEVVALNIYDPLQVTEDSLLLLTQNNAVGTGILAKPKPEQVLALENFGRTCRAVGRVVRPLLYYNIHVRGYVPAARILESNWPWRHHVKVLHLDMDFPRRLADEATWLNFTAGMVYRLLTNFTALEHLQLKIATDDGHKVLQALTGRLKGSSYAFKDATALAVRLRSLGIECNEDHKHDSDLQDLTAVGPFIARFPNLELLAISADHVARSPPILPILESVRAPLKAMTVIGVFREHCVPLLGAIAENFPDLEQLVIRDCDRVLQEPIFKIHAAPALRKLEHLRLFKVSCPGFNGEQFRTIVTRVAPLLPSLLVMGLEEEEDTWGIWRDGDVKVKHFERGHLQQLQTCGARCLV